MGTNEKYSISYSQILGHSSQNKEQRLQEHPPFGDSTEPGTEEPNLALTVTPVIIIKIINYNKGKVLPFPYYYIAKVSGIIVALNTPKPGSHNLKEVFINWKGF